METAELDQATASAQSNSRSHSIVVGVARPASAMIGSPLMLEIPSARQLPAPLRTFEAQEHGVGTAALPAQFATILAGLVVGTASLIVVAYVLRSIGSIILWMALAAVAGLAVYRVWRAAAMKPSPAAALPSANRPRLPVAMASGIGRLCFSAGASIWRGSRRRLSSAAQVQEQT